MKKLEINGISTSCESFTYGEVEDYLIVIATSVQGFGDETSADDGIVNLGVDIALYPNHVNRGLLNVVFQDSYRISYSIFNSLDKLLRMELYFKYRCFANPEWNLYD